ncbi:hypothetical protein [Pelagibacterium sp.]|uniref:hypothetical protein n=1 Tax=Pelagibacterium sp. TaxID=1967288 RepID=UPI003A93C482
MRYASYEISSPQRRVHDSRNRRARHLRAYFRLEKRLLALIDTMSSAQDLGADELLENLAFREGFDEADLVLRTVRRRDQIIAVIAVPHRIFYKPDYMAKVRAMKRAAKQLGRRCLIVPQSIVDQEPRRSNAELLHRSRSLSVDATSRLSVLVHLMDSGASTLRECAELFSHENPVGSVLRLAWEGTLRIDLRKPIGPETRVEIAEWGDR